MDSAFVVLGLGADPRMFGELRAKTQSPIEQLALTYPEQPADDFSGLLDILALADLLDLFF